MTAKRRCEACLWCNRAPCSVLAGSSRPAASSPMTAPDPEQLDRRNELVDAPALASSKVLLQRSVSRTRHFKLLFVALLEQLAD